MPANTLTINGLLEFTLGDSKMPPLMTWLERYSYEALENVPDGEKADTVFAEMVTLMAKAHYGDDFEFDTCIIKRNIEKGIHTATFTAAPLSSGGRGNSNAPTREIGLRRHGRARNEVPLDEA